MEENAIGKEYRNKFSQRANEIEKDTRPTEKRLNVSIGDQFAILNAMLKKVSFRLYIELDGHFIRVLDVSPMGENHLRLTIPHHEVTREILVNKLETLTLSLMPEK
jgi:hypothetical protein